MATATGFTDEELRSIFPPQGADYDEWVRAKVQQALDDPRPHVSNEEAERRMEQLRARARAAIAEQTERQRA